MEVVDHITEDILSKIRIVLQTINKEPEVVECPACCYFPDKDCKICHGTMYIPNMKSRRGKT